MNGRAIRISRAWSHKQFDFFMTYNYGFFFVKDCENFRDVLVFQDNHLILRYHVPIDWSLSIINKFLICDYYGTIPQTSSRSLEEQETNK